jgi:membrane-associated phospholipid phosphatase
VAAARALTRVYPEHSQLIWTAAALIVGVQLPAGAHYPSDLVAGSLVGLAARRPRTHS